MKFHRYRSLENHYRTKFIERVRQELDPEDNLVWCATEKIHGANFSYWYQDGEIRVASRSDFVDETFYAAGEAIRENYEAVRALADVIRRPFAVFGELCGGNIQRGVDYGERKRFLAFDIYYPGAHYESPARAMEMLVQAGFETVPLVATGSLVSLLDLDVEQLVSRVIEFNAGNIAEGVVLRPETDLYTSDGSRAIIKKKTAKFTEKSREPRKPKPVVELTDAENAVLVDLRSRVNQNRVNSATSKLGEFHPSMIGKLIGMIMQDVIQDYNADNDADVKAQFKDHWKVMQRAVVDDIRALLLEMDK